MSGGDLPPRQKMIGMMYLVLTALLALNISKSILDAFVKLNTGIEKTTVVFDASNGILYNAFDKAAAESPAAKKWADKAAKVKKEANGLVAHIDGLKSRLIELTDGLPKEVADTINVANVNAKDNYDVPSYLMGIADPAAPTEISGDEQWSGMNLKKKMNAYQKTIIGVFEDKDVKANISEKTDYLSTPDVKGADGTDTWEVALFYHAPLAATITMLSKLQADVRTSEAEVINKLYERIDAGGVSFNAVKGMAVTNHGYVLDGDTFRADVFTAAYDDRVDPEIFISTGAGFDTAAALAVEKTGKFDPSKIMQGTKGTKWGEGDWYQMSKEDISAGKGNIKIREGVGVHQWGGLIKLNTKKGPKVYPFSTSFEVGKPSTTVAATAMNVFYMGIDNPVSVSAPMPNFKASAPGLRSGKGQGLYVMKPKKVGKVNVNVTGTDENGKTVNLGKQEFRVKRIPTPVAYIAGKTGTVVLSKGQLGDGVIQAKLEGFVFDLKVKVKSFELGSSVNGDYKAVKVSGNRMNSKAKNLIKRGARGQRFYIEKMAVRMPDGRTVTMGNMTVKLR